MGLIQIEHTCRQSSVGLVGVDLGYERVVDAVRWFGSFVWATGRVEWPR